MQNKSSDGAISDKDNRVNSILEDKIDSAKNEESLSFNNDGTESIKNYNQSPTSNSEANLSANVIDNTKGQQNDSLKQESGTYYATESFDETIPEYSHKPSDNLGKWFDKIVKKPFSNSSQNTNNDGSDKTLAAKSQLLEPPLRNISSKVLRTQTLPSLWVLYDNDDDEKRQSLIGLAKSTGLPFTEFVPEYFNSKQQKLEKFFGKFYSGYRRRMVDIENGIKISPPYPDIILSVGQCANRNALYCSKESLGATLTISIENPKIHPDLFDIVLTTQQSNSFSSNTFELSMDLYDESTERDEHSIKLIQDAVQNKQAPIAAVLIDRNDYFDFGQNSLNHLIQIVKEFHEKTSGSCLLIATEKISKKIYKRLKKFDEETDWVWLWDRENLNPWGVAIHFSDCAFVPNIDTPFTAHAASISLPMLRLPMLDDMRNDYKLSATLSSLPSASSGYSQPYIRKNNSRDSIDQALNYIRELLVDRGYKLDFEELNSRNERKAKLINNRAKNIKHQIVNDTTNKSSETKDEITPNTQMSELDKIAAKIQLKKQTADPNKGLGKIYAQEKTEELNTKITKASTMAAKAKTGLNVDADESNTNDKSKEDPLQNYLLSLVPQEKNNKVDKQKLRKEIDHNPLTTKGLSNSQNDSSTDKVNTKQSLLNTKNSQNDKSSINQKNLTPKSSINTKRGAVNNSINEESMTQARELNAMSSENKLAKYSKVNQEENKPKVVTLTEDEKKLRRKKLLSQLDQSPEEAKLSEGKKKIISKQDDTVTTDVISPFSHKPSPSVRVFSNVGSKKKYRQIKEF